jgi:hypothetical protein
MTRKTIEATLVMLALVVLCSPVAGNVITAHAVDGGRPLTPAEVAGGAPAGGRAYTFAITTDSDLLAFENVRITTFPPGNPLYNHPLGDVQNANKPTPGLEAAVPAITADSWFDTPGTTFRLGADLPDDGGTAFADLQVNGPQTEFVFAQLTFGPDLCGFQLEFRATILSTTEPGFPFSEDFVFTIPLTPDPCVPEPAAHGLLAIAAATMLAIRRKRD